MKFPSQPNSDSVSPLSKNSELDDDTSSSYWNYLQRRNRIDPSSENIINRDHLYSMRPYKNTEILSSVSVGLFYFPFNE